MEYTDEMVTKITKDVDGEITVKDLAYEYDGDNLVKLTKTIDSVVQEKTFTYVDDVLTNISKWV